MSKPANGPSSDAWGVSLTAPQLVPHQGMLLSFARAAATPNGTLYFQVLDPRRGSGATGDGDWSGWYRFTFPGAPVSKPVGEAWQQEQRPPELRLAGMDLITVTTTASTLAPADAAFQVFSDGMYLVVLRPTQAGSLYMNRLVLQHWTDEVLGTAYPRYGLEPAWEVRYQRSGIRDWPLDSTDTLSSIDLTGAPFLEPTIEFGHIRGAAAGFDIARVPTSDAARFRWYVASIAGTGLQLSSFTETGGTVVDFTESTTVYPLLAPTVGGHALPALPNLAPAVVMYAEQEPATDPAGTQAEVQRAARLMVAFAVSGTALGTGLTAATAVYDFGLDADGVAPPMPQAQPPLLLVDGAIVSGAFQPDNTSPAFPTAAQAPQVTHLMDGQVVTSLVLGQLQPHTDLSGRMAEDGLLHLYAGGPLATVDDALSGWGGLVPGQPRAMVAQFDPRVSRLVLTVPWKYAAPTEQPAGNAEFVARQSGPIMSGSKVQVTDTSWGKAQPDLCDVTVTYPAATGWGSETWRGVPREVAAFAAVLNGEATDDAADPEALNGTRPYFDFSGTHPLARLALQAPPPLVGFAPVAVVTTTRTTIPLTGVSVTQTQSLVEFTMNFQPASGAAISVVWPNVPGTVDGLSDIFEGSADTTVYPYVAGSGTTTLFGLATDAYQIDAPVLFHPTSTAGNLAGLTIIVKPAPDLPGVDVTFNAPGGPFKIANVPRAVADFAKAVAADSQFAALGLLIDITGVAGNVLPTESPTGALTLRGLAALFDLLLPDIDLAGWTTPTGTFPAGTQQHVPPKGPTADLVRLGGFVCVPDAPEEGIPAYIQDLQANGIKASVTRLLRDAATPVSAGAWIRQSPPMSCTFTGTNSVTIPVAANNAVLPPSLNLRPQPEWTLEAWVQPSSSGARRVITFHDAVTVQPPTAPALDYRIALEGQDVVQFSAYTKQPGQPDSSFFQTGTSAGAAFLLAGAFTWECWIQPQTVATPAGALGGIIQVQMPHQPVPAFAIMLNGTRHVVLRTSGDGSTNTDYTSVSTVPAMNSARLPVWTHIAVVGTQQSVNGPWSLTLLVNAVLDSTFTNVALQQGQVGAFLIIGANTVNDASLFGRIAALRFWNTERTAAEIRRTAFTGLVGNEPGLLGCWPITGMVAGGPTGKYLPNTATLTGADWNADYYEWTQPVSVVADDYFLSLVASIAGLPAVEVHAALPNDRWNHIAVVYLAGGALNLNPASRFNAGRYDWARCPGGDLNPGASFAIDAWIQLPAIPTQNATIMAHWAWDQSPADQCWQLAVDTAGNLTFTVSMINNDQGDTKNDTVTSAGTNLADGTIRHVAAVFTGIAATNQQGSTATYTMTLYANGKQIGKKTGVVASSVLQLATSQTDVLIGRTNLTPAGVDQPVESLGLFRGTLGQLRFWSASPGVADLFPELSPTLPRFDLPKGLAAEWAFRDAEGVVAADNIGSNDAVLTSSACWSNLNDTSVLQFVANGAPIRSVVPYTGTLPAATKSQFNFGAPLEAGVGGLIGDLGSVSLWGVARDLSTIRGQQFTPRVGDEPGLLAYWDFTSGGIDLTGGGNDPVPPIDPVRLLPGDLPVSNEGALIQNIYGGPLTYLSASTIGRIAAGSYAVASGTGTRQGKAMLKRAYVLDPNASPERPIDIGLLDLIYVGQVQTDPTLIGYIEGAPPVPSENLSRPYYLSQTGAAYTAYNGTASVTLTQQSSRKIAYSSSTTTTTDIDFKAAIGLFGIESRADWSILLINKQAYDLKSTVQAVAATKATYGDTQGTDLSGEWTAVQKDTIAVKGDWEPYQSDPQHYLNPQVGRRFVPANLGYALVESLVGDLFAMVYHATGAAVGTLIVPNLAIPPDRNLLLFPMNPRYTKNGTLDGKVGLVNDPSYKDADVRRGSYFRPTEAYALAASLEAQNERRQAYAAQFDWKARGQGGNASLDDARPNLPVDFDSEPGGGNQGAVPATGIANRYVWSADKGLHVESQGYASVSSRSYTGWRNRGGGGGLKAQGEFFFYLGFAYSLDLLVTHMVDVHVGLKTDQQQSVSLDVTVDGEPYLPAWDPTAPAVYGGGTGAFLPGYGPGKVQQYRFFSFLLPASQENADAFAAVVDPVWKQMSNDPTARAMRELDTSSPAWRVLHRVTYVERIPPPIATRPVYTAAAPVIEPQNVGGNLELLALITGQISGTNPTPAQVGAAVAVAINPAPTAPGVYPASLLEQSVAWWGAFLKTARPTPNGPAPNPQSAELLTRLVSRIIGYTMAGLRSGVVKPGAPGMAARAGARPDR